MRRRAGRRPVGVGRREHAPGYKPRWSTYTPAYAPGYARGAQAHAKPHDSGPFARRPAPFGRRRLFP